MDPNLAASHLQVIRTLMERSALYRRALAPVMSAAGLMGLVGAGCGLALGIADPGKFVSYWYGVGFLTVGLALLLVRRQAWKQAEPFWSPPTRRVAQALLPALALGLGFGLVVLREFPPDSVFRALPCAWIALYGCAIHAAGFFMPRGMKVFGWGLVLVGFGAWFAPWPTDCKPATCGFLIMAAGFGALHLAYGAYLFFTERSGQAA